MFYQTLKTRLPWATLVLPLATSAFAEPKTEIFQTTRQGDRLASVSPAAGEGAADYQLTLDPGVTYQTLIGIGGAFTDAGGAAIGELSKGRRDSVLRAYFSPEGAHISLTRTHIGSCDFSVTNYHYAPAPGDVKLEHFSIEPDRKYLLPMIKDAIATPGADFKILASPWTAPPWMKTKNAYNGGSLRKEHYKTFSDYIVRYIQDYKKEGIPIWGITPENEPLGNGSNWESMEFTSGEMRDFIGGHLGPALAAGAPGTTLWGFDHNRDNNFIQWADTLMADPKTAGYLTGFAVHWYQSTDGTGNESLAAVNKAHPGKPIMHTEGCIDTVGDDEPVGSWLQADWYWRAEATDWGFFWASEEGKKNHPKYRPFHRYTNDLIDGFNAGLVGWIDWNLVLNARGGPNHARNFCLAPILVDAAKDSVSLTPLYFSIAHFSKYIRPGAKRIGLSGATKDLSATAFQNPDGSLVAVVFNPLETPKTFNLHLNGVPDQKISIPGQALQTVVVKR
ncbi:MAG: glycoside hydrolase family 30 protein [Verrucomicrobiota bacterium]